MPSITSGAISGDGLNIILCGFIADRRCACVCKTWSETMQKHFSLVISSHFQNGTLIKPFITRALSPRLTLEGLQNQGRAAILEDAASLFFKILRIESRPVTIDQIMCLRTPNIERLIQANKDKNLVSFYNVLRLKIAGLVAPDFTKAGEIRDWMRDNSVLLAQVRILNGFDQIITEIPEEIIFLTGLTVLDLSHTQIAALPDGLNFPELKFLYLSHTPIAAFPDRLNAPKLVHLNLRDTQLAAFPNTLSFSELVYLDLRGVQIITLPHRLNVSGSVFLCLTPMQMATWPSRLNFFELAALRLRDSMIELFA